MAETASQFLDSGDQSASSFLDDGDSAASFLDAAEPPPSALLPDLAKRAGRSMVRMPGQVVSGYGGLLEALDSPANLIFPGLGGILERATGIESPSRRPAQLIQKVGRQMTVEPEVLGIGSVDYTGALAPDPRRNQELLPQVAESVGSLAGAFATPGGPVAKTMTGAVLQAGGQSDEARQILAQRGATEEEQNAEAARQFVLNLPAGALEGIGWGRLAARFGAKPLLDAVGSRFGRNAAVRIAGAIGEQALIEAGEEAAQTGIGNITAAATYDPLRPLDQGVGRAALVGGIMGSAVGGGLQSIQEVAPLLARRLAGKTEEQASKAIREEAAVTEEKAAADALTDAADTIDREIAARETAEKLASERQKAAEAQAKEAERVAKEQQRMAERVQAAIIEDAQPPEIPKSQQILTEAAAPKPLANVATEVATQTKQSPYALQGALNEMTAPAPAALPQAEVAPATPVLAQIEPGTPAPADFIGIQEGTGRIPGFELYNLTQDIPGHPAGSTVSRETLESAGYKLPKKPKPAKQNAIPEPSAAPLPLRESPEGSQGVRPADIADQATAGTGSPTNEVRQEPVQEPLSHISPELRLNNAGIDLPPISSLNAAQKLTELQAAGVTTYKGKPIADANPAQLSAALGQHRRGQLGLTEEAPPEPPKRKGKISGSKVEKWADDTIKRINKEGRASAGLDPTELAAHTIKLVAQLERGAVSFADWSAAKLAEVGEAIRPYLQRIWLEANATAQGLSGEQPVAPGGPEFRGRSESSLLEYDTVSKGTDASKLKYADEFVKWHEANGTPETAISEMRKIEDRAFRKVVAAKLLAAEFGRSVTGSVAEKAATEARIERLLTDIEQEKGQSGQALQAESVVNDVLRSFSGELALRGALKRTLEEEVGSKFPEDAAGAINAGLRQAGEEAASEIPGATTLISGPLARIQRVSPIDWRAIFTSLPENQEARKAEIFNRIKADPKIAALPGATQQKLADAMEKAWEAIRNRIFKRDFSRLVPLPNVREPDREKLEESLPELTKMANLGLLDNAAFMNALADKYGIERVDGKLAQRLRELGQKAERTPEGSERNKVFQDIMDTIMEARGVSPWDFLKDFWYRNVMSAPRTAMEIGVGGVVQGAVRTMLTAIDTAIALRRPDVALKMTAMFLRDMGTGVILGTDLIRTGDRSILPRYTEKFLADMDKLQKGESPGGAIEFLYRNRGPVTKGLLFSPEMVGRILTALDYIGGQGIRNQQMIYSALVKKDKASFDAAMKQFDVKASVAAERQARKELGPNARFAQVLARKREILNEGVNLSIQKYGNQMTEVAALNASPVGISGMLYRGLISRLPMWVKAPSGLAFAKAGLNLFQEYSNWLPVTGQINAARALWREPSPTNPFRHLALKDVPPERARQIISAQAIGLGLAAWAADFFLGEQPEDKEGKPRKWEISGSWSGLTQDQKSALMNAGEKQYAIKMPSGRWVSYKPTPFVGIFAGIGNMRDQQRFNQKKWDDKSTTAQVVNSWLMGLFSLRDLSVSSQAAQLLGIISDPRGFDEEDIEKRVADTLGNSAVGLAPMSSLLREVDYYFDQQRYRPAAENQGADLWMKQIPFVRRGVSDGQPMLNFLGEPIKVVVTPYNRHIGELPATDPLEAALSEKVSMGMRVPATSDNTTIVVTTEDGNAEQRPMNSSETYTYQKAVRQGFASQLANDLSAFTTATPEQASLYAQEVFNAKEKYVRNRMNLGMPVGIPPVDARLSSAATPDYQQAKELNASEATPSALARSRLMVAYDEVAALPVEQRGEYLRQLAAKEGAPFVVRLVKYATSPAATRTALEAAEGQLEAETRGELYGQQIKNMDTEGRRDFMADKLRGSLLNESVVREMAQPR